MITAIDTGSILHNRHRTIALKPTGKAVNCVTSSRGFMPLFYFIIISTDFA